MVLQSPSNSPNRDGLDQTAPDNDEDIFAEPGQNSSNGGSYRIDHSLLRLFPLSLNHNALEAGWEKGVRTQIQHTQKLLKRPLTQSEVDAYAELSARMLNVSSYGNPIGITAGLYRAYTTASTFRFPLYQPNLDTFQPGVWPSTIGLVRGHRAVWAWHATRVLAYTFVTSTIAGIVLSSYAGSTAAVKMQTDPRLKEINEAIHQQIRSKRGLPKAPAEQGQAGSRAPQDDASPTGGMYGSEGVSTESGYGAARPNSGGWSRKPKPPPTEEVRESEDGGFAVYDDASPTGGQGVSADTSQPQTSGSAWDRLRRGERPTQNTQADTDRPEAAAQRAPQSSWDRLRNKPQPGQGDISRADDGYSYAESNEHQESARERAQREFDAQVERERRGGDFSSGSGDQKRW